MGINKTIGQDFGYGFAGVPSRSVDEIISSFVYKGEAPLLFGSALVLDENKEGVRAFEAGNTAEDVLGFTLVNGRANQTYGKEDFSYTKFDAADVLVRGSLTIKVEGGVPVIGQNVFVLPGGLVTADGAAQGAVKLPNVVFSKAGKDQNNMAEITILSRRV